MHLNPYLCISFAITNGSKTNVSLKNHTCAYEHNRLSLSYGLDPLFQLNPRSGCCRASLTTAATATAQLDLSPAPSTDAAAPTCWTTLLARFQERVRRQTTHHNKTSVHTWDSREQVQSYELVLWPQADWARAGFARRSEQTQETSEVGGAAAAPSVPVLPWITPSQHPQWTS